VRRVGPGGRAEMDVLAAFIDEECVVSEDATASAKALYSAYTGWCSENGEKAESQRKFGGRLKERGFENGNITSESRKGYVEWYRPRRELGRSTGRWREWRKVHQSSTAKRPAKHRYRTGGSGEWWTKWT
jgi:phage/plasmid-associated DNA primase